MLSRPKEFGRQGVTAIKKEEVCEKNYTFFVFFCLLAVSSLPGE